ncbi:MAG: glycerophosphodiester phosphodiesterase [Enterovirga sp.]|nr:glycerophosphodiester phosphodiesterase [Enterovirga sp.]
MSAPAWLTERPIAHRGLHVAAEGRFENTLAAAEAAIAGGFAIECDVQLSADGEAVVFHDHTLDRLTALGGPVRERPAAELARTAIGRSEDRIPTLPAFLDRIGERTPLVIEIKSRFDGDERLARRTAEVLRDRKGRIAVKSFDSAIVGLVRRIAPDLPRGIVGQSRYDGGDAAQLSPERLRAMTDLLHWDETQPHFISWRHLDLPCAAAFLPRQLAGVPVMTWTIRSPEDAARARAHADQIVFEGFLPA